MHYRMLVTATLSEHATSERARFHVYNNLLTDDSFCGQGGRFDCPICDWFVIGGGWSGLLRQTLAGHPPLQANQDPGYDDHGHEDDAMLVNRQLYDQLLAEYAGKASFFGDGCEFVDLDDEPVTEDVIGRKWLVVVDYHN